MKVAGGIRSLYYSALSVVEDRCGEARDRRTTQFSAPDHHFL